VRAHTRIFKSDHDRAITAGGMTGLVVYLSILRIHSDAPPEEKKSFRAGAARIARHAGCSTKTAKRMLPILESEGLITILSGKRKDRQSDHEENRITLKGSAGDAQSNTSEGRDSQTLESRDSQALGRDSENGLKGPRKKKPSEGGKENAPAERTSREKFLPLCI
jgi:hypothetical protein